MFERKILQKEEIQIDNVDCGSVYPILLRIPSLDLDGAHIHQLQNIQKPHISILQITYKCPGKVSGVSGHQQIKTEELHNLSICMPLDDDVDRINGSHQGLPTMRSVPV